MLSNGGYVFAADPRITGLAQPIFSTPQTDPAAIILQSGPALSEGSHLTVDDLRAHAVRDREAALLRLNLHGERFDVSLSGSMEGDALAAVIPLDEMTPDRLTALGRFWSAATGRAVPADPRITPQRLRNRQRAVGEVTRGVLRRRDDFCSVDTASIKSRQSLPPSASIFSFSF